MSNNSNLYQLDGRVPVIQAIPFGLQHVLAVILNLVLPKDSENLQLFLLNIRLTARNF